MPPRMHDWNHGQKTRREADALSASFQAELDALSDDEVARLLGEEFETR